jgi:valyl-tRNA synthetase
MAAISGRLNNPGFVAKAPEEVIEEARERQAALLVRRTKIEEALARLKQTG